MITTYMIMTGMDKVDPGLFFDIKDINGDPLSYSPNRIDSQLARMKSENVELSRKISQQDKIIEILQTNYY